MRRLLYRDDGVSMVLVAILLVVILGFAGIAIDLGRLWVERRELRTGADAVVLAIAEDCALGTRPCDDDTAMLTALAYAGANDEDGVTGIDSLELDTIGRSVRVVTYALDAASGERGVEVPLMGLFGFDRVDVHAPATAIWGYPAAGEGIPITVEECEFFKAGYGPANTVTLMFHDGQAPAEETVDTCSVGPAGQDYPGGFGWLDSPDNDCWAYIVEGEWTDGNVGGGAGTPPPGTGCTADYIRQAIYQQDIPIPVYSAIQGAGAGAQYYMEGFAIFHVTAYKLGNRLGYWQPSGFSCPIAQPGEDAICLQGYFTTGTLTWGEIGGQNFGAVIVKLTE